MTTRAGKPLQWFPISVDLTWPRRLCLLFAAQFLSHRHGRFGLEWCGPTEFMRFCRWIDCCVFHVNCPMVQWWIHGTLTNKVFGWKMMNASLDAQTSDMFNKSDAVEHLFHQHHNRKAPSGDRSVWYIQSSLRQLIKLLPLNRRNTYYLSLIAKHPAMMPKPEFKSSSV